MVFLAEDLGQGPVAESVDVAELAFAVEDLLRPFAGQAERLRERAEQLDDLRNVVVIFAVFGAGLRVEEVVSGDQFKDLISSVREATVDAAVELTMHAMLQTSVLAPHFAPNITSGDRY